METDTGAVNHEGNAIFKDQDGNLFVYFYGERDYDEGLDKYLQKEDKS